MKAITVQTIVVPVDFSPGTDKVTEYTIPLAKAFSAKIYLVHVVAPNEDTSGIDDKGEELAFPEEKQALNALASRLREEGIETHALLTEGVPIHATLDEIENLNADLVVVGSHGHSALYSTLRGRVCQGIIDKAPCPILIVPTKP